MTVLAYAIDFGTTNSLISAVHDDGRIDFVPMEDRDRVELRSLVYLHRGGDRLAGQDAVRSYLTIGSSRTRCGSCELRDLGCRTYKPGGDCGDGRLLSQVKSDLADANFSSTHSWGDDFAVEELVAVVLRRLKRAADRHVGQDVRRLVIGQPVRFAGAEGARFRELQSLAEGRLEQAAAAAGFAEVRRVPEPQAAVAVEELTEGVVLCVDFGGGTFDVAVLDVKDSVGVVRALSGVAVGGEDIDALMFDAFVRPGLDLDRVFDIPGGKPMQLPARYRTQLRSLAGLKSLVVDPQVAVVLRQMLGGPRSEPIRLVWELLYGGQAWSFYGAIEQAKIELSEKQLARVMFSRPGIPPVDVEIRRSAFDLILQEPMGQIRACIADALTAAALTPGDISYVAKTGGSSRLPAFQRLLDEMLPGVPAVQRDPYTTVVRGLAEWAYGEWAA